MEHSVTRIEAEAKLAELPLLVAVDVADVVAEDDRPRQTFRFSNPRGLGEIEIEIDADPSPEQLADLSRNLPVPDDKRAETLAKLTGGNSLK